LPVLFEVAARRCASCHCVPRLARVSCAFFLTRNHVAKLGHRFMGHGCQASRLNRRGTMDATIVMMATQCWRMRVIVRSIMGNDQLCASMRTLLSVLVAAGMCLFGLAVLSQQVFAWHHLKVVTVIGGAMLTVGLCILYEKYIKEHC